jgi:hypothetical protein
VHDLIRGRNFQEILIPSVPPVIDVLFCVFIFYLYLLRTVKVISTIGLVLSLINVIFAVRGDSSLGVPLQLFLCWATDRVFRPFEVCDPSRGTSRLYYSWYALPYCLNWRSHFLVFVPRKYRAASFI